MKSLYYRLPPASTSTTRKPNSDSGLLESLTNIMEGNMRFDF